MMREKKRGLMLSAAAAAMLLGSATAQADITIDSAVTETVTHQSDETVLVTQSGSITIDQNISGIEGPDGLYNYYYYYGGLTNLGNIEVNNTTVESSGAIRALGIFEKFDYEADIISDGNISASSSAPTNRRAEAAGIFVEDYNSGEIKNSGSISASAAATNDRAYATGIFSGKNTGTISNSDSGSISVSANSPSHAEGSGIFVEGYNGGNDGVGRIYNSGSISVALHSGSYYAEGSGIQVDGDNGTDLQYHGGEIKNSGSISVTVEAVNDGGAWGIGVEGNNMGEGSIVNTGSITLATQSQGDGDAAGISVNYYNRGLISNGLYGSISAAVEAEQEVRTWGINVDDANYGRISNFGSISLDAHSTDGLSNAWGLGANSNDEGSIKNTGEINATARSDSDKAVAAGIAVAGNTNHSAIANSGTMRIVADGNTRAAAVGIHNTGTNSEGSTIDNSGTITTVATATDGGGSAAGILNGSNLGSITNSGSIVAEANATGGIYAAGIYSFSSNQGSIDNTGSISVAVQAGTSLISWGIGVGGDNEGNITNSGTLSIEAEAVEGGHIWGVAVNGDNDGNITNSGSISVTLQTDEQGKAVGLQVFGVNNGSILNAASGTILAQASNDLNATAVGIHILDNNATISNSGTIEAYADGPVAQAYSIWIENGGAGSRILNSAIGTLIGNLMAPGTAVQNDGTIRLGLGESKAGSFAQSASGSLGVQVRADSAGYDYSKLTVEGDASFADGTSMQVDVSLAGNGLSTLVAAGQLDDVISAGGALDLNVSTLALTDNSDLLDFTAILDGNTLDLGIVQTRSIYESTVASSYNGSADAAAALDEIRDSGSSAGMDPLYDALYAAAGDEEVGRLVAGATPQAAAFTFQALAQMRNLTSGIIGLRQSATSGGGLNSGGDILPEAPLSGGRSLWLKPFTSHGDQDRSDGLSGFDLDASGIGVGIDSAYGDASRVGLAFFYTDASMDLDDLDQSEDLKDYALYLYGSSLFTLNRPTRFYWQLGYSWQDVKTSRQGADGVYRGSFDANTFLAEAKVEQEYRLGENLLAQVSLSARYLHFHSDGYTEDGPTPALANTVESASGDRFVLGLGSHFDYALNANNHLLLGADLGYNFGDHRYAVTSSWGGVPNIRYRSYGHDNGGFVYKADIGYRYENDSMALSVGYQFEGEGSHYRSHSFGAKISYKF